VSAIHLWFAGRFDNLPRIMMKSAMATLTIVFSLLIARADLQTITITTPQSPQITGFNTGESRRPDGTTLTLDSRSLRLNGKPWMPVMGEFH
jgi:hypothetical protein